MTMLRKIRITSAVFCFVLITLLFLDFTGTLHLWLGWLAKIQLVPAILALNIAVIAGLLLLTVLFGRIYCSVICPLGVYQDFVSWLSMKKKRKGKKKRFKFSPSLSILRYAVLALFIVVFILGFHAVFALLDPYSAYGRIVSNFFSPIYQLGNNMLARLAEKADSYVVYRVDIWLKGGAVLVVSGITLIIVSILAWRSGRIYCNTICPVGTILGVFSRFSIFKPTIITENCTKCGTCVRNCKSSCIDVKTQEIDYSRCVVCMNCIDSCKENAMKYNPRLFVPRKKTESAIKPQEVESEASRRNFLSITALMAFTAVSKAQEKLGDGGLAVIEEKKIPKRVSRIVPAGAQSIKNLETRCTACQLCISACPNQVLRPSGDLMQLMQPEMSFERGYCRPECVRCSEVCPTGAISPISKEEKSSIQIGHAVWIKKNCVVLRDEVTCTSCERHCPVGAIQLVAIDTSNQDSLKIPVINIERCIGCGACENLCPSRPYSAIYVEGHVRHKIV